MEKTKCFDDTAGFLLEFECGDVEEERLIEGFQHLIDTGLVWKLQGMYGRMAEKLIESGRCTR